MGKRIAIGLNCGVDTYRARTDHNQDGLQYDKNVTLKTKYKLMPSESPPTLKKDENFSAVSGPELPSGPILPSHHPRQDNSDSATKPESLPNIPTAHRSATAPHDHQ